MSRPCFVSPIRLCAIARQHILCSQSILEGFCRSVVAVALGLRLSYLLDIQVDQNTCCEFLTELRATFDVFGDIFFLRDEPGDHTFLVNVLLLRRGLNPLKHVWIAVKAGRQECTGPPPDLIGLFQELRSLDAPAPLLKTLPVLDPATLVALAGCLLEYPAVYVPSPDLWVDGVDLMLWRVVLMGFDQHTLLQFTYPSHLVDQVASLQPDCLQARLESTFQARLQRVTSEWTRVRVEHDLISCALIRL